MARVRRPFWFVVSVVLIGKLAVAAILAAAGHYAFEAPLLYPGLAGLAGGVFAWAVAEEKGWQGTWLAGVAGGVAGTAIFAVKHLLGWKLATWGLEASPGLWAHLLAEAEAGLTIGRRSVPWFTLHGSGIWALWAFELALAGLVGGALARSMDLQVD